MKTAIVTTFSYFKLANLLERPKVFLFFLLCIVLAYNLSQAGPYNGDSWNQFSRMYSLQLDRPMVTENTMYGEYYWRMRSWFQPAYGYAIAKVVIAIIGDYPLLIERVIYFCNYLLFILSLWCFLRWSNLNEYHYKNKTPLYFILAAIALYPLSPTYITTTSQEAFSSYFLVFFLYTWYLAEKRVPCYKKGILFFVSGLLACCCFQSRFQVAFIMLPYVCVYGIDALRRKDYNVIFYYSYFILGGLVLLVGQLCIDYWGYGVWTFPPYHYFRVNLIEGLAARFSVDPFYYYITKKWIYIVLFLLAVYILRPLKNIHHLAICLSIISFFMMHTIISHKENRFLIPLLVPFCYVLIQCAKEISIGKNFFANKMICHPRFMVAFICFELVLSSIKFSQHLIKPWIHVNRPWWITVAGLSTLEALPPKTKIIASQTNYYAFHKVFSKEKPIALDQKKYYKEYDGFMLETSAMSNFLVSNKIELIYAQSRDYKKACLRYPQAYVFEKQRRYKNNSPLQAIEAYRQLRPPWYIIILDDLRQRIHLVHEKINDTFNIKPRKERKRGFLKQFSLYKCADI